MASFDTGDVVRIAAVNSFNAAQDIVNTWHVYISSGGGVDYATFAADVKEYLDDIYGYLSSYLSDLITDDHITIKNITQGTVWGSLAWGTFTGGSEASDATAPQVCCLGFLRTEKSRVQVRKYLGVFTEANMSDGTWSGALQTAVENAMIYHMGKQTLTNGVELRGCAYNYTLARTVFGQSAAASDVAVIQRRRRPGRGS